MTKAERRTSCVSRTGYPTRPFFLTFYNPPQCTTAVIEHADKIYGKDGALKHIRGNWLGVNPEVQQRGYARAIHEFNMREVGGLRDFRDLEIHKHDVLIKDAEQWL